MHKRKDKFSELIYRYCDENVGKNALFLSFTNLYPEGGKRNGTSLAKYTSKIVNELVWGKVLREIERPFDLNSPHGLYKILEHERLVDELGFGNGKEGEMIRDVYNFDFTQDPL